MSLSSSLDRPDQSADAAERSSQPWFARLGRFSATHRRWVMVVWLVATKRRREAAIVLVMLAAVTLGSEGVKELVARPRPSGTDPNIPGVVYSFPSGHVLEALTILGIITIRGWRSSWAHAAKLALVVAVIVWVLLVGLARMALNAHYPSDVLAGLLGGSGALAVYGSLTRPRGDASKSP